MRTSETESEQLEGVSLDGKTMWSPGKSPADWVSPLIKSEGKVVDLPFAAMQPTAGSRVVFDVSLLQESDQVPKGLVRVTRWLNLNAAADIDPRQIHVTLVLHGEATGQSSLSDNNSC